MLNFLFQMLIITFFRGDGWDKVHQECLKCLKAYMNNKTGLKRVLDNKEAFLLIARSIDPLLPHVMQEATKLLAVVCLIPPGNYNYLC